MLKPPYRHPCANSAVTMLKCTIFAHLGALSDHDCSEQSGRRVNAQREKKKRKKEERKKSSISHNGVSGSIPSHTSTDRRKSSGTRRISLVHADSARRFVAHVEKSTAGSRKSRFSRPPTFVRALAAPPSFCSVDNEAQNRSDGHRQSRRDR